MKELDTEATYEVRPWRGITTETMQTYNVLTKIVDGKPDLIFFPYDKDWIGKTRKINEKVFATYGENTNGFLFGQEVFPAGSSNVITITEGELDALSIYQVTNRPAVSVRNAATARGDITKQYEYVNSFDKIILALDGDGPGQKASQAIAGLFDFNKVYVVGFSPGYKDANSLLTAGKEDDLRRMWWNAKHYLPEGVISTFDDFYKAIDDNDRTESLGNWPWETLQGMTYGIRPGEVTLFTAPEGIGKTEIIRACEYKFLESTDHNLGIIHLEESKARTIKGLAGLSLSRPVHLPDCQIDPKAVKEALHGLVKRDDRLHVYSHFGTDDPDAILDTIRFLAAVCGCRVIALDHITMLVTGKDDSDERKYLDYLSTKLAKMSNDLKFHLWLVSHVNDDGQTRGSRNISKVAHTRVDIARDITAADEEVRNKTFLTVSKNRFASYTGPAGVLQFDRETFGLTETFEVHEPGKVILPT